METKPFQIQAPEDIAKEYGGDKQKIAQAMQMGILDPTAGVLAGMFIDRIRSAQTQEMMNKPTVAQQVMGGASLAPVAQPPMAPQAGLGALPAPGTEAVVPPPAPQAPPEGAPMGMAGGGLADLPVPDGMFDEPENGGYGGGGLVAFADGGDTLDWMGTGVSSEYGVSRSTGRHQGRDYLTPGGTRIGSVAPGVVKKAGYDDINGNYVVVQHPDGSSTSYAHLAKLSVEPGEQVSTGELLGLSGNTGRSRGAHGGYHLHFGARNAEGQRIDPRSVLGRLDALRQMSMPAGSAPAAAQAAAPAAPAAPLAPAADTAALAAMQGKLDTLMGQRADDLAAARKARKEEGWARLGLMGLQMMQPQQYGGGGVVRYAAGSPGALDPNAPPAIGSLGSLGAINTKLTVPNFRDMYNTQYATGMAKANELFPTSTVLPRLQQEAELMASDEYQKKEARQAKWEFLAQLGFGMAGSNSPHFLQALNASAAAALPGLKESRKDRLAAKRQALRDLAEVENTSIAAQERKINYARQLAADQLGMSKSEFDAQIALTGVEHQQETLKENKRQFNITDARLRQEHADNVRIAREKLSALTAGTAKPMSPSVADSVMGRARKDMADALEAIKRADEDKNFGVIDEYRRRYGAAIDAYNAAATRLGLRPVESETVIYKNYKPKEWRAGTTVGGMVGNALMGRAPAPVMAAPVGNVPAGIDPLVWGAMRPEERALWED